MCQDRTTDTVVAIKVLHKDEDLHPDTDHEVRMYRKLLAGCDHRSQYVESLLLVDGSLIDFTSGCLLKSSRVVRTVDSIASSLIFVTVPCMMSFGVTAG